MCSVILSQWREQRLSLVWQDVTALTTACVRVPDLLQAPYLRLRKVIANRVIVIKLEVNDRGGNGRSYFGIDVRAETAEMTSMINPANKYPEIISSSKTFYSFTTLLLKQNLATSRLTLFWFNFNEWPCRLDCDISKRIFVNIFMTFLRIFTTSIKSPLNLLLSKVKSSF